MDKFEKEAVLRLAPYFNDYKVIVDAGSNKGEWSDLLINNVDEAWLFEPNIKLLHFTEMKYDMLTHVHYKNVALYKESVHLPFYYFDNSNNGLSSLYKCKDDGWDGLPMKEKEVTCAPLDSYEFDHIDFLKIDVEGAEFDVLKGAEKLLREGKIKFIQLEYSGHYQNANYNFKQVVDFITPFGYFVYEFNREFLKADVKEDFIRRNYYIMQEFTEDWNSEFIKNTQGMRFNFALEIGAFEGLTSCYICDNLLNEMGRMIAIDPLKNSYLTTNLSSDDKQTNKDTASMFKGQYNRFKRNTQGKPIELIRKISRRAFKELEAYRFDFIYIDGDHRKDEVYNDAVESMKILKVGGHILFDDYEWRPQTTEGINMFLSKHVANIQIIEKGYQVLIKKIASYDIK